MSDYDEGSDAFIEGVAMEKNSNPEWKRGWLDAKHSMRLRNVLRPTEKDELKNVMLNEPVWPGNTISHQSANSLHKKGLIARIKAGWVANWEVIKNWKP